MLKDQRKKILPTWTSFIVSESGRVKFPDVELDDLHTTTTYWLPSFLQARSAPTTDEQFCNKIMPAEKIN